MYILRHNLAFNPGLYTEPISWNGRGWGNSGNSIGTVFTSFLGGGEIEGFQIRLASFPPCPYNPTKN